MAAFDTTRPTYGASILAGRFSRGMHLMISSFTAWNDARKTRKALSALSDRELADIGLSRADIDAVADGRKF